MLRDPILFALLMLAGCAPEVQPVAGTASSAVQVTARVDVPVQGALDFEILGDAVGQACADPGGPHFVATLSGQKLDPPSDSTGRAAFDAAVYDAMNKARTSRADSVLVTWTQAWPSRERQGQWCAEVHGKMIRLTKAAAVVAPAPLPVPLQVTVAAPIVSTPDSSGCVRDAECKGARVCVRGSCTSK